LKPDASSKYLSPGFLCVSISFSPSFVITLFSLTSGTISDIVPRHTKSKYFKYSFASKFNFIDNPCINLNTTPTPASSLNGYLLDLVLGSITAFAFGRLSNGS